MNTLPDTESRIARLTTQLGAGRVEAMLEAARATAGAYLPGEHHPAFGFIQRALIHLKNDGRNCGLIFPKVDGHYQKFIDYFDGEDRIFVIYPGSDAPDRIRLDESWLRESPQSHPDCPFFEVVPGCEVELMLSFLEAYAHMRGQAEAT